MVDLILSLPTYILVLLGVYLLLGVSVMFKGTKKFDVTPKGLLGWTFWLIGSFILTVFWLPTILIVELSKRFKRKKLITSVVLGYWKGDQIVVYINGDYIITLQVINNDLGRLPLIGLNQEAYPHLVVFQIPDTIEEPPKYLLELRKEILTKGDNT